MAGTIPAKTLGTADWRDFRNFVLSETGYFPAPSAISGHSRRELIILPAAET